jgi:hypothetical protein
VYLYDSGQLARGLINGGSIQTHPGTLPIIILASTRFTHACSAKANVAAPVGYTVNIGSDVPGLAWPKSPGLGLALEGSGLAKPQARPFMKA